MSTTSMRVAPVIPATDDALPSAETYQSSRHAATTRARPQMRPLTAQIVRFSVTGALNTAIDVLALNALLLIFDLRTAPQILLANAVAYTLGAVNSFFLNKRWTFGQRTPIRLGEVGRFTLTTLVGIGVNDTLLWAIGQALLPLLGPTSLLANTAKIGAIGGTVLLSFLGMRLWVFVRWAELPASPLVAPAAASSSGALRRPVIAPDSDRDRRVAVSKALAHHGLSIVLPAYNEEQLIRATLADVTTALDEWGADYEVIVVNDGSRDRTGEVVTAYAASHPQVRIVTHLANRGYGAAVASGFAAAANDLTFFMDSDGQFTIADLPRLLVHIDAVDAVLGYRVHRQDSRMRLLNAAGWKALVYLALGVRVRDLDCAYKLLRTDFLRTWPPATNGALINAELLYTLHRVGATYREVGVRHLPRTGGRATGANLGVILRALRDLARYTWNQRVRPVTRSHTLIAR